MIFNVNYLFRLGLALYPRDWLQSFVRLCYVNYAIIIFIMIFCAVVISASNLQVIY